MDYRKSFIELRAMRVALRDIRIANRTYTLDDAIWKYQDRLKLDIYRILWHG